MRKGDTYTFFFALAVCIVCSLLLSGSAALLQGPQDRNRRLDERRNVLKAMGVDSARKPASEINSLYETHVEEVQIDPESGKTGADEGLPLLFWREDGTTITRYALPISGKGLWSTIRGFLALESDGETIAGITFFEHGETPGLGGEIEKPWFQEQFKGKKIWMDGPIELRVVKGDAGKQTNAVDGISGATMTGRGVEAFLNENVRRYDAFFKPIREQS